jgi:hypothetical protein
MWEDFIKMDLKIDARAWTGFNWLMKGSRSRTFKHGSDLSVYIEDG